jgi:hypothetical protein
MQGAPAFEGMIVKLLIGLIGMKNLDSALEQSGIKSNACRHILQPT